MYKPHNNHESSSHDDQIYRSISNQAYLHLSLLSEEREAGLFNTPVSIESRDIVCSKQGILIVQYAYLWSTSSSPLLISMGLSFPPSIAA